jgi:hypothetical protein
MLLKVRIIVCKASFPCVLQQDGVLKSILVLKHNTLESCWVTLYGKVYDVSDPVLCKCMALI